MAFNAPWVDRRGAPRTVPMEVLVLGFCRTGTASTREALKQLGYKDTYHMQTVLANPLEFFGKGKPYGREEWDQLLGHCQDSCQAVTDTPAIMFSEELIAAYPDAKVVLTSRDPSKWWKSYSEALQPIYRSTRVRLAGWLDPRHFGKVIPFTGRTITILLGSEAADAQEEASKARFVAHYENIRNIVPKARLLEYEVGEGWDPLCAFLDRDVPGTDFPRINDTKALQQKIDAWMEQIFRRTATRFWVPGFTLN
ncbi:P-loop containing nucleoside triphosphate hydrolase protein [Mycena epipterygia]|nr:P-loop containing nucleoside triphosphate hydrolase protein [Mycena epipterygia]